MIRIFQIQKRKFPGLIKVVEGKIIYKEIVDGRTRVSREKRKVSMLSNSP